MKTTIRKTAAVFALAFAAATLTGCKEDDKNTTTTPATSTDAQSYTDISRLDKRYHVTFDDIAVRTATGREVKVTVSAYCEKQATSHKQPGDAYRAACRKAIGDKLMYGAAHEDGISLFESYLPMGSAEIRPYNMFTEEMMLRAVLMHHDLDLYTVTDVHDCKTGARTPLMDAHPQPPEGGWPDAAARKKLQSVKPMAGTVVAGACKFG